MNHATELIDALRIRHQNGKLSVRQAIRRAREEEDRDLRSRLCALTGTCWLSAGKPPKALAAFREARQLAISTLADAEASELRVSIAIDLCQLHVAMSVAEALAVRLFLCEDGEAKAIAHYKLGLVLAYCGELRQAEKQWEYCLQLTQRPIYRISATHNLAKIAAEEGKTSLAWQLLGSVTPLSDRQRLFASSTAAKLHAQTADFGRAVTDQRRAVELSSSRSLVDRAMVSVDLVRYLALAGQADEASTLARDLKKILWLLEEEGRVSAALALRELSKVTNAAELVRLCREAKATLSDQPSQHGGRSFRRRGRRREENSIGR